MNARAAVGACVLMVAVSGSTRADVWDSLKKAAKVGKVVAQASVKLDDRQERSIGRAVAVNVINQFGLVQDPELTAYVNTLGNYLASASTRPELPYRFVVLDTSEVNAFACPGGYVFVSRGALAQARDESELAGVLAHEIVHLTERHGVRTIEASYRKKVLAEGLGEAAAQASGADPRLVAVFGELTDELTGVLFTKGLSREFELDADRGALELVAAAGYDPEGIVRFVERLGEGEVAEARQATLRRTHPEPADRAAALRGVLDTGSVRPRPEARWPELLAAHTQTLRR